MAPLRRARFASVCYRDEGEAVLKIASTEAGSKSETLHEKCAAHWFAVLDGDE